MDQYSSSKRRAIKLLLQGAVACAGGLTPRAYGSNSEARSEEKLKELNAKYILNFASPYTSEDALSIPHAHNQIKQTVEKYTNNKVFVRIIDGGVFGVGAKLANVVSHGLCQGALISVSNLSAKVPEVDLLNIPFWLEGNQEYLRLVKSDIFSKYVLSKLNAYNLELIFPYVVGGRTITTVKGYDKKVITPKDFAGLTIRTPRSRNLKHMYRSVSAFTVDIDWEHVSAAITSKRFDAIDPSIIGLYAGLDDLKLKLSTITQLNSVQDGWFAIGSKTFFERLDHETSERVTEAFRDVQTQQVKQQVDAEQFCTEIFKGLGVDIYTPSVDEIQNLKSVFGYQQSMWDVVKNELLGTQGTQIFERMTDVAKG